VTLPEPWPIDQTDQKILGAADFAVHLYGELRLEHRAFLRAATREQPYYRRHEFVKSEDRRGRKAGQHDHRATVG
jgi:hypothetical protein